MTGGIIGCGLIPDWCCPVKEPGKGSGQAVGRMENIEEVLRKFKLSEEEREGVCLEEKEVAKRVLVCRLSLIRKVWGEKQANIGGMRSFVSGMWSQVKNVKVIEIGRNCFSLFLRGKET